MVSARKAHDFSKSLIRGENSSESVSGFKLDHEGLENVHRGVLTIVPDKELNVV